LAWNGDMLCTSMMRGFNRTLLCMRYLGRKTSDEHDDERLAAPSS
jgi:hypothetical protein